MPYARVMILALGAALGWYTPAMAADQAGRIQAVAGEKLDSGLGQLPHYRHWPASLKAKMNGSPTAGRLNPVLGEKLDSGLGELPRYSATTIGPVAEHVARK